MNSSIHPNKTDDPLQGLLKYVHEQIQKNVSHSFLTQASSSSANNKDLTSSLSDDMRGSTENASQIQLKIQFSQSLLEIVSKIADVKNRWKQQQEENKEKTAKMLSLIQALKQTLAEQKQEIHVLQHEKQQQYQQFVEEKEALEKLLSVSSREISTQTTDSYIAWSEERRRSELLVQQMRSYIVKSYEENRSLRHELKQSLLLLQAQQEMLSLDERKEEEDEKEREEEDDEEEEEEEIRVYKKEPESDRVEIKLTSVSSYRPGIAERYRHHNNYHPLNEREEEEEEEDDGNDYERDLEDDEDNYDPHERYPSTKEGEEEGEEEEEEEEEEKMNTSLDSVEISSLQRYYQYNLSPPPPLPPQTTTTTTTLLPS